MQIDDSWYTRPPGLPAHDSAGGVVVRADGDQLVIALVREGDRTAYTLPKGRAGTHERPEDAARREIGEESGLCDLTCLGPLGMRERLNFGRTSWKRTHYFLFLAPAAGGAPGEFPVEWFPLDALPAMVWPEQRLLIEAQREHIRAAVRRHLVQDQFRRQAAAYARSESHAAEADLSLLVRHLRPSPQDRVLDVATGTGFTAFALAQAGASVVGVDLTLQMLQQARPLAPVEGIRWVAADAAALPFAGGTFHAVTVRRAPHHFADLDLALREVLRVLRPGGRIGIVDQVPPEDEAARVLMEHLEKLRDASHVETYTARRWRRVVERLGVTVSLTELVERRLTFQAWLELAGTDPAQRTAIEATLRAAPRAARAEIGDDGSEPPSFVKRWLVLVGTKGPL